MESVNELLAGEALRHQVALQKLSNSVVARMIAILNRSDRRMFAELAERLERMDPASFSIERLESMLTSSNALSRQAYAAVERELTAELRAFVDYETSYQHQMLVSHVPVQVSVAAVSADAVYAAAVARPFQGVMLRDVWRELDAKKMRQVRQAIAQGFLESKTTDQVIRELRGTRAKGFKDGLIEVSRRDAEAVVRTAMGHMAGFVQDRTTEANADIIKAVRWSATLDLRTSPTCRPRDGKLYEPVSHKPIGHTFPWLSGPGRAHWRCRSAQVVVLKSYKELGVDIPEVVVVGKTRASMDGQLPAETSYAEWLKKQPASRQDEVLGQTRARLLREGDLPLERMYSQKGEFLTIQDLRERDAKAFERAGL